MKELNKKKYVTLITIIILVMGIIGIINVGNIDLDKGKVKLKSASIEKLKSSVIESKGYEEITYPVLYELEKVEGIEERTVIIKGTLTKEENKYARFKEITSNNITSTVSENGRKIEIKIEKVKLGRQNKINLKIEINGAINETKIKPEIEIKEVSEKEYIKVKTEEIEVKTNSVTGLVQDEEGMSVSNLELSINKGNEEIRRTYTDENGRYVFSDVEEGKYTIKVEEENYELKEIKEVEVIGGITENIIVKKIKPYEIEAKKYISKIKLNNNGKEIEYEYGKLNKVNQTVKNLKNLSGEIEYKIEIKNTGEKSGEITKIEEEVTEGLKFNKEKNSEWEEKNGKIINRSLEGIKLKAGEEKEITLKLDIEKTDEARSYLQKVTAKGEVYQNVVYILGGKEYKKEKVLDGEKIEEPNINQENFKGWYTDKNYTNKYNFENSVTKDIILYGKIEESTKKYTVQYIDEGKIIKEEELEEGSIINVPEVTKEGHTFIGWYEGEEKYDVYEPITRNLILESKYEINKYKVRFINEDESVLQEEILEYGSIPTYKKETPTKTRTEEYTYEFDKWTPEITKVTSNQEYKATYKKTKNKYTVIYINEGTEYHKEILEHGSVITSIQDPTKEGYTFTGWYTKDNEKVSYPITVTEDITLYSKYEINSYKVSYYNEGKKYIEDQKINYGENALKPNTNPSKIGYTFKYWSLKENGEEYEFSTKITKDITLYAVYEINKYTVTYINEGIEYHKETLEYGNTITSIQNPTKEGYTFTGWYTKDNEKVSYPITVTEDITLYSKYEINSYKVSYYNEGKKYIEDQKINYGENALKPNTNPSKIGYTFKYWSLKENGEEYEFSTKITKDITLYAVYEINKYTVTYINEGIEYHKETAEYGSVITEIQDPTKEGYTFTGWYTKDNEKVSYPITVTKNITLYSKYEINSYKVSYYNEGKKYIEDQKINYGENALKPNTNPSKIGYTFKYWSLKENGEEYEFSTKITKDITLYAVYEINKYTVTYINEGIEYHKETAEYGSVITEIQDPIKEGYTFIGWYDENNQKVSYPITVTEDITLHSKYEINTYTVSFYHNNEKYVENQKVNYGESAVKPSTDPTKEDYNFSGWVIKGTNNKYDFTSKVTKDIELESSFTTKPIYTVTFKIENEVILTENVIEGHKVTSKEAPYKKGYLFDKWYSDEGLTIENNFDEKIMGNKTIYGKYNENKHTVTYINEGTTYYTEEVLDRFTVKGPSINPSKEGYTFKYFSKDKKVAFDYNAEITEDTTLYAVYEINKYTVTYINEESEYHKEELTYGSKHEKIEDPFKTGYTFIGWYNENEEKVEYPITVTKDITLHSKYNINKYTVTYINEGAKYIEDQQINYKEKAVKPDPNPSKIGYTFKYWSLKENGEEYTFNSEITKNITLYAVYSINKYTVTYINEESEYHKEELTYGSKHEKIEDPFKTGYTFIGWYNENEEKVEYPITVTKDITLHSKYNINKYTVTYINEGAKYIEDQQINYKEKAVKPDPNPSKIGYTFKYWSIKENGEEYNFNSEITKNITLYAVYEINKYTVTYINEESEYHKEELTYGSKHEKIEDPFKTGYTFIGWYNENEEKVEYPITVTKDITLHSKYEINKYTVTFNDEDRITTKKVNYNAKVEPVTNQGKTGYTFKYWSIEKGGEEYNFNTLVTENITLYAVYNINKYTVTFKNYDGSILQEETLEYGIKPKYKGEEPIREKTKEYTYTFKGWDKEITEVTNNQEYIATYTEIKNKYNVKFTNYDGSILQEETLEYGTLPVYKGEVPTREKTEEYTYTFKSWNKEITEVTDNEIYIAVYTEEKNKYTVIYMDGENEYTRKEVNYGETVSEEVISKDHNIYRGWTLDGNIYDFNTPVTKNITINSSFELVESPVIESTPIEWTKENVKVTISSNHNDYSYMYKIDDGEYQNYNGEFTVDKNCTVIAKSIKENVESEITTKEITNIDKVLPEIKELTEENITTKSFDIKVKGQDNESGLSEIRIYKNDELMVSYPYTERLNEEKEETYSLTGLEENTTYKIKAELIDKVGNINVSEEKEITTLKRVIVSRIIGRNNSLYESEEEYELFESLENAITSCGSNECTIEMVLNTNESVNVLEGQEIKLELNGKTVTGVRDYTIENSGELIIDNDQEIGSITNTNGIGIKNIANGILQIGENEEPLSVSVAKPNIVGTTYGIYTEEETAKLKFYDGKIEGNVAIQGNVDDTPYLYNAKITNEGHQVATLSILAEAEAKITGGKYYTKLTNAVSESKIGTYKTEEQDIMSNFITPGLYGFDYDEETKSLISNNAKIRGSSANSYIKLDLTDYEYDQELTIDSLVSTYRHYGYVTITKSKTIPSANNTDGRIIYITAENSENSAQATTVLEKGNVYYLHLGYAKSSSYNDYTNNEDVFKITNIKINNHIENNLDLSKDLITPGEYGFTYSDGILKSNNQNKSNTTANSYIKVDLTNYLDDKEFFINATVSSERNNDIGYITITDSETIPSYNSTTGRVVYISGDTSGIYKATLTAGKINYIHLGYRKDGSANIGTDTFTINKIYTVTRGETSTNVIAKVPILNENVDTVELIKDVTLSSPIEVASTKEMIIDLNGKTLTTTANDYVIKNSGNLTIIDSKYQKDTEKYQAEYEAEQAKNLSKYNEQLANYEKIYSDVKESCPEVEEFKIEAESTNIVSGDPNWSNSSFSGGHGVDYAYDLNFEYDSKNIGEKKLKIFGSYLSRNAKIYLDDTEIYSGAFGTSSNYGNFEISLGNLEKRKYTIRFTSVNGNYAPIYDYFEVSDSTTFKCDAFNESDVSMDNFKFIDSNNSSNIWNSYYNTQYNGVIYYLKKVIVNEGEVYTAKGDLAVYNSTSNVTTDIYVGFSSSKEINKDDFVSYKLIKAQSNSSSLENYMISIDEPGEYYFKIVIDKSSTNRFTSYLKIDNIKFKMHPELQQAVLQEAIYTGTITSSTNSIIYNDMNANLMLKEGILELNKSGEYNAITNDGILSVLENTSINTKQANNRGIYNGYNAKIENGGTTINQSSSGYGIYNVSKVDDGFSDITFNLNTGVGFYNENSNIVVNNIKTTGSNGTVYTNAATLTINDSSLDSKIVSNGNVTINNSTHKLNSSNDELSDELTINDCNFTYNIRNWAIWGRSNTLNINNSTVTISHSSQYETSIRGVSNLIVNNSNITRTGGRSGWRLLDGDNITIKGNSTINSNLFGIVAKNLVIGEKDGVVTEYPYITTGIDGISESENVYIYDGTINSPEGLSLKGTVTEIEDDYELSITKNNNREILTLIKPENAVASIDEKQYLTLQSALDDVSSGQTIKLLDNIFPTKKLNLKDNANFSIDLNKHTIRSFYNNWLFENNGTLSIIDSNTSEQGTIYNNIGKLFKNNGTLELNNISIYSVDKNSYNGTNFLKNRIIENNNELKINKLNTNITTSAEAIYNNENATTTINDSTLGLDAKIVNDNIMNVNNTTINGGNLINNSGKTLNMDKSTAYMNVNNSGIYNSNGSSYTSSFSNNSAGNLTSTSDTFNGTISNSGQTNLYEVIGNSSSNFGVTNNSSGIINMYSGTINSQITNSNTSTLNIYDGTIKSRINNNDQSTVNLIGGTINSSFDSIVNNGTGTINIGTKDGTVNLDSPTIISTNIGVTNNANGKLNFYDGKITGSTAISGPVTEIEEGYDIIKETVDNKEVKYLAKQAVAQIESTKEKYNTIQEAINAVTNTGETIKLLRELTTISSTSTIEISGDKDIILDLNGYNVLQNNTPFITNNGTFTLKDSAETTTDSNGYTVYSGTITSSVGNVIENNGTFNYDGGTITSSNGIDGLIINNGLATMNGGYLTSIGWSTNLILNKGDFTINNGYIISASYSNKSINNSGTLTINDGTFKAVTGNNGSGNMSYIINNTGNTNVYGGTVQIDFDYYRPFGFINNESSGNVIIDGLTNVLSSPVNFINNIGTAKISNSTIIGRIYNSGTMDLINLIVNNTSQRNGIYNSTGTLNIHSGEYNVYTENNENGTMNIIEGTFISGVSNTSTGTINIGTKGDLTEEGELNVSKTNPNITNSNGYGLTISRGKVNFYDGIISGTSGAINGTVNEIEDGYEIISGKTEDGKESKYLALLPVAKIVSTNEEYYNLQEAIDAVTNTGETIKIIRKYTTLNTLETITVPEDKNIIIDLNGYIIEQNNENFLVNNGILKIIDSSENNTSSILMNTNKFIENNKDLAIENIKINAGNTSLTNVITNNSNMTIENSSISVSSVSNMIENSGTLNMNDTSLTINNGIGINNTGILSVTGGTHTANNSNENRLPNLFYNTGNLNIIGGTYNISRYNIMLKNNSEIDSKIDGIITTSDGTIINNIAAKGILTLANSNIAGSITNFGSSTLNIENSTVSNVESSGSGIVNLKTVTFTSNWEPLETHNRGTVNVYGATINKGFIVNNYLMNIYDINLNLTNDTIRNYGTVNVYGGTLVSSETSPITNYNNNGVINIGTKDGNVSTESPVITGKTYGVSNSDSGKVNFYDGIVSGETGAFYGTVNEVEPGYKVVTNKVDTLTSATLALVGDDEKVAVLNGINFSSLQDAINSASDTTESIITLYANIVFDNNITVPANKNIKLYLNGYTLNKGDYDFTGEGKITVIDGTSTNALASIIENVKEVLNIGGINKNIIIYEMDDGSAISSESTYKLYKDNEEVMLEEDAIGIYSVGNSNDEIRSANKKIYINELPKGKYKLIGDNNKEVKFEIDESGKIIGNVKENTKETRELVSTAVAELIIMIQTGIEKVNYIMIILTLLVTISSLLYIVKKVNVRES